MLVHLYYKLAPDSSPKDTIMGHLARLFSLSGTKYLRCRSACVRTGVEERTRARMRARGGAELTINILPSSPAHNTMVLSSNTPPGWCSTP